MTVCVVVGLSWNGYDIQREDLGVFLEISEGLDDLPELRAHQEVIPFRHGQRSDMPYANGRPIVLTGVIMGPPYGSQWPAYRGYADEVKQAFTPFATTSGLLLATLEDGTQRWIRARPLDLRPVHLTPGARKVSIELIAHDPFWYSAYGTLIMDDGIEMDDDYLMDSGGEISVVPPTTEVTFDSQGTADVERIRIRFIGPSDGPVGIDNLTTPNPVGFLIDRALDVDEEIVVNSYARTAKLDGTINMRGDMTLSLGNRHGEYLRLLPGSNTLSVLGEPAECRISFFPTWL